MYVGKYVCIYVFIYIYVRVYVKHRLPTFVENLEECTTKFGLLRN